MMRDCVNLANQVKNKEATQKLQAMVMKAKCRRAARVREYISEAHCCCIPEISEDIFLRLHSLTCPKYRKNLEFLNHMLDLMDSFDMSDEEVIEILHESLRN
jgi:hypothetical protein